MRTKKFNTESNYTKLPNHLIKELDVYQLKITLYILSLPDNFNLNKTYAADYCGLSRTTFINKLNKLIEIGYFQESNNQLIFNPTVHEVNSNCTADEQLTNVSTVQEMNSAVHEVNTTVQQMNSAVHEVNSYCTAGVHNKEEIKKKDKDLNKNYNNKEENSISESEIETSNSNEVVNDFKSDLGSSTKVNDIDSDNSISINSSINLDQLPSNFKKVYYQYLLIELLASTITLNELIDTRNTFNCFYSIDKVFELFTNIDNLNLDNKYNQIEIKALDATASNTLKNEALQVANKELLKYKDSIKVEELELI